MDLGSWQSHDVSADPYSLDGKRLRVVAVETGSVVSSETHLLFSEDDALISARYDGGRIRLGYLVGRRLGQSAVFRYAQMSIDGDLDGGVSYCDLAITPAGRLRMTEHYEWESREGSGTNVFEEVLAGES